jgi:hypothetical protein
MADSPGTALSVRSLFEERAARRRREQEDEEQLRRKQAEELAAFKQRLEDFQVTDERVAAVLDRIRRAFDRGERELMLTSFPSSFCTDHGRTINNPGVAPPDADRPKDAPPAWLDTLPAGARRVYDYWKANLKPGGFEFSARIINFPGGMPGDVGLFLSWKKSSEELNL